MFGPPRQGIMQRQASDCPSNMLMVKQTPYMDALYPYGNDAQKCFIGIDSSIDSPGQLFNIVAELSN